jgi:hypothetical protein
MLNKTPLSQLNEMIREDLITEGIITGRDGLCGSWKNPEMFPRHPYQMKCDRFYCPVCNTEKVVGIRKRVSSFTNDFQSDDGILYLLTLTIPHNQNTDLNVLYKSFSQSVMRMKNSSVWRNRFKKEIDHQFHYNRYETTITPSNSFHLHLHITLGGYNLIDTDEWKMILTKLWRRCCRSVGVKRLPTITNGVDIRITSNGTYSMKLNEDTTIPNKQDSYTPEDLQKILTGYKRIPGYRHMDFSLKEIKKYLTKYKRVFTGKKYMKIYFDNDDYKWKWNENRTTIEGLFV